MPTKKILRLKIELRANINQRPTDIEGRKSREKKLEIEKHTREQINEAKSLCSKR